MTPRPGRVSYAVVIEADADRLWDLIRVFGDVAAWNPIALESRLVEGREGEVGAERELTLTDPKAVRERLTAMDDRTRRLGYEMVSFPIPVVSQVNEISVDDEPSGATRVTFESRFRPSPGHEQEEIASLNRAAFQQAAAKLAHLLKAPPPEEIERAEAS